SYEDQPSVPSTNDCATPSGPCAATLVQGFFEPVQAVWQDDPIAGRPHFADRPGKRLTGGSPTSYVAELPMVKDKPTLLYGIGHPQQTAPESHPTIRMLGRTTGTTPVRVGMRFRGTGAGVHLDSITDVLGTVDLDGPCGEEHDFEVDLPASRGYPGAGPFTFP